MDLINRKAAIDKLNAIPSGNWSKERYMRELLNLPSAPAVPLDKLCEWLADYAAPPANASNEKALENHETRALIWRHFFEKMIQSK